jgi:hypothetical protein
MCMNLGKVAHAIRGPFQRILQIDEVSLKQRYILGGCDQDLYNFRSGHHTLMHL